MASSPLPKGVTGIKIIPREWGIEKCYRLPSGSEVSMSVRFDSYFRS
ncbi:MULTISPECIES: hypothetical protein [Prochlorococcus]|nr:MULTISPECIES: hypothetical protein [Prochlorococcus]KGG14435.1 hypothetical protein EV04_0012 [Prochlorococcus marinus str. LG]KGG22575.1 hypothetical protein EV08_0090 [Prochlorococcus marinus str. SS2]KGG34191.1 hypothetical protein EV10_0037 [Prochlorococcus marinus str. SS51]